MQLRFNDVLSKIQPQLNLFYCLLYNTIQVLLFYTQSTKKDQNIYDF